MVTNTILRNVLLLEGKDYTPEQIDDILKNKPVTMTIHEAITLNNRLQAINYATNIADRPSYAAALDLCKILGRDIEPDSDLRSRALLTEACKVLLDNGESIIDFESKDIINKALDDDALLVNILSNQSLGETIEYNGKKYQVRDILTIVPPALREAYGSDCECAKQFVAEYASQIIL